MKNAYQALAALSLVAAVGCQVGPEHAITEYSYQGKLYDLECRRQAIEEPPPDRSAQEIIAALSGGVVLGLRSVDNRGNSSLGVSARPIDLSLVDANAMLRKCERTLDALAADSVSKSSK